jgi:hypothetical protein
MILLSGLMFPAGPVTLSFFFADLVDFLTPPMGATVGLAPTPTRRLRRRGREFLRRAATMVSRDWSSFPDMLAFRSTTVLCWRVEGRLGTDKALDLMDGLLSAKSR